MESCSTKLDMLAYQQLVLNEDSKTVVAIDKHKGLYWYTCLPFRIYRIACPIFQRVMEGLLAALLHIVVYLDHVLAT